MSRENRKYERYEISGAVQSNNINIVKCINVSLNGIRVLTDRKLGDDDIVEITFSMPGITNLFAAEAKVVWQRKADPEENFDTGLIFNKINVDQKK
jgi:hypothetical protein